MTAARAGTGSDAIARTGNDVADPRVSVETARTASAASDHPGSHCPSGPAPSASGPEGRTGTRSSRRSVRDEETRALLAELRTGLDRRLVADERQWVADIATEVGAGRFVRALRLSSRSPKAGMAVPAELADRLVQSVDDGLGERTSQELWVAALDALASSPVRARVRITSRPAEPGEELLEAVRRVADILPGVAALFGVDPSEAAAARKRRPRNARPERQRTAATPRPPARDGNRSGGRAAPSGSGAQPDRSSATPPEAAPAEPSAIDESPAEQPE